MITANDSSKRIVRETIELKLICIAKFQRKIPYLLWDKDGSNKPPYFDSLHARQHGIITYYGFNALLHTNQPIVIKNSSVGMNHFSVTMPDDSYLSMEEFMISENLRKTETTLVINNITPETMITIMAEIDREKYLGNGAELEDLYINISPANHVLESMIKQAYQQVGFNLLSHDPTLSNVGFLFNEAYLLSQIGMFNYTQRLVTTMASRYRIGSVAPNAEIDTSTASSSPKGH